VGQVNESEGDELGDGGMGVEDEPPSRMRRRYAKDSSGTSWRYDRVREGVGEVESRRAGPVHLGDIEGGVWSRKVRDVLKHPSVGIVRSLNRLVFVRDRSLDRLDGLRDLKNDGSGAVKMMCQIPLRPMYR
jgi:hypothetical protein